MIKGGAYKLRVKSDIGISVAALLMLVLVIAALWTRISGLAERQFAQDEYYFIKSVQNILEFGFPRFSSGGYYIRGILLQYLTAASIVVFGDGFFAYRFPSALFGAATVVMAYYLARQFLSRSWSIVLVAVLTISSWEVELSRFARMYSAFQFVAVCFFWSLYRYSYKGNSKKRYFAIAFALMGILTHELGVLLTLFLFLPCLAWLDDDWLRELWRQRVYIAISLIIMGLGLFLAKYDFRSIGVPNALPLDYIGPIAKGARWSSFGISVFGDIRFLSIGILTTGCIIAWYALWNSWDRRREALEERLLGGLLVLAVCCAVFHQLAISAVAMLVIVLRDPKSLSKKPHMYFVTLLTAVTAFWLVLLISKQLWIDGQALGNIAQVLRNSIRQNFFVFPDLYLPVINTWAVKLPVLGFFLGISMVHQIISIRKLPLAVIVRHPVIPILISVFVIGVEPPSAYETRYCYFLYPLALCVGLISAAQVEETLKLHFMRSRKFSKILGITLCLFLFSMSEDFNAFHLSNLNSDIIAFRTGTYERFASHWYPRWDFQHPADLVNTASPGTSKILISCDVDTIGFYLNKEFAIYFPRDRFDYNIISREKGTRELWSGKRMISRAREVIDFTEKAESVWLVLYPEWGTLKLDPENVWPGRVRSVEVYKPGRDKRIEVWKIELQKEEDWGTHNSSKESS